MTHDRAQGETRHKKGKPFPWRCTDCGSKAVSPVTITCTAEAKHDGRLHTFEIPDLRIPVCGSCGEKVFTNDVDDQITAALRCYLRLLTPEQIRKAVKALGMSQKDVAERLGVAEASLSRWVNGTLVQSRAMDNLMRVYFASPRARAVLVGIKEDPSLGTRPVGFLRIGHTITDASSPFAPRK